MARVWAVAALLLVGGCVRSGGFSSAPPGTERGECFSDGTCEPGLVCLSNLCVKGSNGADATELPDGTVVPDAPDGAAPPVEDSSPPADLAAADSGTTAVTGTLAGQAGVSGCLDGLASAAQFNGPRGIATYNGNVYVADTGNNVVRLMAGGQVTTLAGDGTAGWLDGPAGAAQFNQPAGLAVGPQGEVYVADTGNHRIRKVVGGQVVTVAGNGTPGNINGAVNVAAFNGPAAVAVDPWGTVYVADTGNARIRKISGGSVSTLTSAGLGAPTGIAVDSLGALYIADAKNQRIYRHTAGQLSSVAGGVAGFLDGPASFAKFNGPSGVAVASQGMVYVADRDNHSIRQLSGGKVSTVAGGGKPGFSDGETALFSGPSGVALGLAGDVLVADTTNHLIRRVVYLH